MEKGDIANEIDLPEPNDEGGLEENGKGCSTDLMEGQLLQMPGVVVKVEICEDDTENIQDFLVNDNKLRATSSLQVLDELNDSKISAEETIQVLGNPPVNSGARNEERHALLLRCQESNSYISGNQNFRETSKNSNYEQGDTEFIISERTHRSDNLHCTVYNSHTCNTFIRKDNMTFPSQIHGHKETFLCWFCNRVFLLECQFYDHLKLHWNMEKNEGELYFCTVCSMPFTERRKLVIVLSKLKQKTILLDSIDVNHTQFVNLKHLVSLSYMCFYCNKLFSSKRSLNLHLNVHTGYKPYTCETCSRSFSNKHHLKSHVKIHTGYKPYTCKTCLRSFSHKHHLQSHVKVHTGYKPYTCKTCLRSFSHKHHLQSHVKVHTGYKPYTCETCLRSFSHKHHLQYHVNVHTGYKPYTCETCLQSFLHKHTLQRHINVHTGYKPYSCGICSRHFSYKHSLQRHLRVHTRYKPYSCKICSQPFSQKHSLRMHLKSSHGT